MITKQKLDEFRVLYEEMVERAYAVYAELCEMAPELYDVYLVRHGEICFGDDYVVIDAHEDDYCGSQIHHSESFPILWLLDELDWREIVRFRKEERAREKARREERAAREQEQRERAQLEFLMAKYGGDKCADK